MKRLIGQPEPGYYKRRLVKGGPYVSVRFYRDGGEIRVEVDGRTEHADGTPIDPHAEWPLCWPSTETDHKFSIIMREWSQRHAPHFPQARPRQPIDLGNLPPRTRP